IAYPKTDHLRIFQFHIRNALKVGFLIVPKTILGTGNTGGTYHVYKSIGGPINFMDTGITGLGGYQENIHKAIFFKYGGIVFLVDVQWQIGQNKSVYSYFLTFFAKFLHTVL